jgi:hypothetical protein
LLEFGVFDCPLWIRRVLVRAQEGQLKAPSQLWAAAALSFSVPFSSLNQLTEKESDELKSELITPSLPMAEITVLLDPALSRSSRSGGISGRFSGC